jgi:hypothetical protein
MRALATILLLLSFPASAQEPSIPPEVIESAFLFACERTPAADCATLERPVIGVAPLLWQHGFLGLFAPEYPGVVWLDYGVAYGLLDASHVDVEAYGILIHETVHYLDYHTTGIDNTNVDSVCASEGRAWWIHNDFMVRIGAPEMARWDWRGGYAHCRAN